MLLYINESYTMFILYKCNVKEQLFFDSQQQRLTIAKAQRSTDAKITSCKRT